MYLFIIYCMILSLITHTLVITVYPYSRLLLCIFISLPLQYFSLDSSQWSSNRHFPLDHRCTDLLVAVAMATRPPQKEVGSRRKVACFKNLLWDFMANGAFFIHLFTCFNILIDGVCCFRFLVGGFVAFFYGRKWSRVFPLNERFVYISPWYKDLVPLVAFYLFFLPLLDFWQHLA